LGALPEDALEEEQPEPPGVGMGFEAVGALLKNAGSEPEDKLVSVESLGDGSVVAAPEPRFGVVRGRA